MFSQIILVTKVPEVKVKEFDRWMGKLKRKDGNGSLILQKI